MSTPLVVTARLDGPTVGLTGAPVMLDGPLSWAAATAAAQAEGRPLGHLSASQPADDYDLPLERWQEHGVWGWCTSRAVVDVLHYGATKIRRKPATGAMSRYTRDARHHIGLGHHKARDTILPVEQVTTATWHVLATDRDHLERLLTLVTHLGGRRGIGMGQVTSWTVEPGADREAWRDRPLPTPGEVRAWRAPYWHPSRRQVAS